MHSFEVHSNESACRKKVRLGLEKVVRLILSIYLRLYLVSCPSPSVLCLLVGGGDRISPLSVSRDGGDLTHPCRLLGTW